MYRTRKRVAILLSTVALLIISILSTVSLVPAAREKNKDAMPFVLGTASALFCLASVVIYKIRSEISDRIDKKIMYTGETALLTEFIEKLRFCYSLDDFYDAIASVLEIRGDCSVLYVDKIKNYVLYNSPSRLSCSPEVMNTLQLNYNAEWKKGIFYIGDNYGIVSDSSQARGFFLSNASHHLYVFCRYTKLFDFEVFKKLFEEFCRFQSRTQTISNLSEISALSKEWKQLADTQRSFLPPVMPQIDGLSVAAYFRPLVNVSGDYYTVLPISKTKTLLMLGDVSGKGLAAALVMGLVMNTVKILENKDNLPGMIKAVDKAIKGMKLQDKYTVLFLGIVDTEKMTIRYVNASMSDPLIITRSPDGYRIKPLTSNCSLVGIIDLPEVEVAEQRLFRGDVILMASDGVSEVMDDSGEELGNTKLYQNTIKASAVKSPKEFIDDVVNLVMTYNGGKKLRDDVTMMVAKVER
ncbi:PP2C family protein-serine/threonine phosphatase [Treponema sp.]|uniref:PP2C family protein-serine/threonine phosphatase n=1 Tax=Treponema sp. TaxID=166 RepID=UPI003FD7F4B3